MSYIKYWQLKFKFYQHIHCHRRIMLMRVSTVCVLMFPKINTETLRSQLSGIQGYVV